jgi:hypothetical protein
MEDGDSLPTVSSLSQLEAIDEEELGVELQVLS